MMEESKKKLYVDRDGFCAEASMLFMMLAMVFRLIGSIGRWGEPLYLISQVALPMIGGLLFLLFVLIAGKKAFWATVIPVLLGVAYFVFQAMEVENELLRVGYIFFYLVIVVLYALTFSQHWMKWLLAAILAAAFLFHVAVLDVPVLMDTEKPVLFLDGMQEMSVLAVILSMLFITLAMRTVEKPVKKKAEKSGKKEETPAPEAKPETPAAPEAKPETPAAPEPKPEIPTPMPAAEEPRPVEAEIVELPAAESKDGPEPAAAFPLEETPVEAADEASAADGAEHL